MFHIYQAFYDALILFYGIILILNVNLLVVIGVTALQLWQHMQGRIFVGAGDGTVELVMERSTADLPTPGGASNNVKRPTLPQLSVVSLL